jgi:hypothetical protein
MTSTDWMLRHQKAEAQYTRNGGLHSPSAERTVLDLVTAAERIALIHSDDYYVRDRILEPLLDAADNALNLDLGRLDGGTLSQRICDVRERLGMEV